MLGPFGEVWGVPALHFLVREQVAKTAAHRLGNKHDFGVEVDLLGGDSLKHLTLPDFPTPQHVSDDDIVADFIFL